MSQWNRRKEYLYNVPPYVLCEFSEVMDNLSNTEWMRFASRVLSDQRDVCHAERRERRTDWVMNHWGMRQGTVGDLLVILDDLQLLRARDIILNWRPTRQDLPITTPPSPPSPAPSFPPRHRFTPPHKAQPKSAQLSTKAISGQGAPGLKVLPKPGPPPSGLASNRQIEAPADERSPVPEVPLLSSAMCWPFEEVQCGTDNFSVAHQIGEGGFGHVYHATLRNTDFAVKRLKENSRIDWTVVKESFKTEVEKLSQYRHPNIVDFVGYSVGGGTHCLLYVFMPNGSLEDQLQNQDGAALSWPQRVSVMQGSAKGIQFLHASSPVLIHGDIKSSNILLGEHLEPKLADFGLARFCRTSRSRSAGATTTVAQTKTVRGTLAYLPEEYVKYGELGVGIDVFSFGVVLLEVLTGRRALESDNQSKTVYLKDLVTEVEDNRSQGKGKLTTEQPFPAAATHIWKNHMDPRIASDRAPDGSLDVAALACRCLESRKKKRPPMAKVFQMLQDIDTSLRASSRASTVQLPTTPSHQPFPKPPLSMDSSCMDSLSCGLSKIGPLEDTFDCSPRPSLSLSQSGSSFLGPCESDESQGYSQYIAPPTNSANRLDSQASLPCGAYGGQSGSYTGSSPAGSVQLAGSLRSHSPQSSSGSLNQGIIINTCKERLLQKVALHKEGRIHTAELLFSDLYGDKNPPSQEPEESDEPYIYLAGEASESEANT